MRLKGTLVEWNDDRGFGFIEPADDGGRLFCHISAFEVRVRRPIAGDQMTYEMSKGRDGRPCAAKVRPIGLEQASYQSKPPNRSTPEARRPSRRISNMTWKAMVIGVLAVAAAVSTLLEKTDPEASQTAAQTRDEIVRSDDALGQAFAQQRSNIQVQGAGTVERVLSDDKDGSRHQRFILRLPSGQTLLVAHNIDLAPRVESVAAGDQVEFYGEYEWNPQGGVIHWTHHDPQGKHETGWIRHKGKTYQ